METGGSETTTLAAQIDDPDIRFCLLNFLQLVGATTDTPALRDRLLQDAKSGNIECLNQLLLFGVSPACPTAHSDTGTLGWAVQSLNLPIFDLILATAKFTPQASSDALRVLPGRAHETTKIKIIRSLAERGASGDELSHQLFFLYATRSDIWSICCSILGPRRLIETGAARAPFRLPPDSAMPLSSGTSCLEHHLILRAKPCHTL